MGASTRLPGVLLGAAGFAGALAADVLADVHRGVGGAEETLPAGAVFGIDGDAHAGRTLDDVAFDGKGLLKRACEAAGDLFDVNAAADLGKESCEFVAAQPCQ